ncbi:MAG: excinuclease ABC subunit UvrA [Pseudomonadota bacterium]
MDQIIIRGARENNLKGIDLNLPRNKLVVITGVSGSGKSSLAFDTIYAEGQRRYVESLSAYARQFLERLGRPDVDTIEGLSPAISIEQKGLNKNPRSTVGTVTEIYDYLRLLYARVGQPHCHLCGKPIHSQSVQQIVQQICSLPEGTRFSVLAPVVRQTKGAFRKLLQDLRKEAFTRVNIDGTLFDLSEDISLNPKQAHTIEVYVDRLVLNPGIRSRLTDSIELAAKLANSIVKIARHDEAEDMVFVQQPSCIDCGAKLPKLEPRLFSFNSPEGACPCCSGLGALMEFDEQLVVPNPELSLREGAIEPWDQRNSSYFQQILESLATQFGFDLYVPYRELPTAIRHLLMHGSGDQKVEFRFERGEHLQTYNRPFEGVIANLKRKMAELEQKEVAANSNATFFERVEEEFHRYMSHRPCPECKGSRLRPEAMSVLIGEKSIHEASRLSIGRALDFFSHLAFEGQKKEIAERLLREIIGRLKFLSSVGLDYLSLNRPSATLSGGEGQRVRLATQIGASLVGVLYILDEPSIGLHQRDSQKLLETLFALRNAGNTVIVVEHDEKTISAADHIVDLGPGAGENGGNVVATGSVSDIVANTESITGQYLAGKRTIEVPKSRRKGSGQKLIIHDASTNNLAHIDVTIPLGTLTCITGVSGSGKSSLIIDTLLPALRSSLHNTKEQPGPHRAVNGIHFLNKVISVDQSPIGRTPSSSPATFVGAFSLIRELFAGVPEAKVRGYRSGRFSFNIKGGRCEACRGDGVLRIEMHFLPDVYVPCEVCNGRRYNDETLRVTYKGFNIADVLEMTVSQASELLANVPRIREKLQTLCNVGLGYLTLGQPATTLSGGEAQRIKLSRELSRRTSGKTLYMLDEPTTGLHFADIQILLDVLNELVKAGNTVVVIEHNLDVIKSADYIVDLGPEGGDGGGHVVAAGTPEKLATVSQSHTGQYLKQVLA